MSFGPQTPWPLVTLFAAAAFCAVAAAVVTGRLGGRGRRAILAANGAAGLMLCLAILDPVRRRPGEPTGSHLAVAVDVSQSVQRAGRDWNAVRSTIEDVIGEVLDDVSPEVARSSTASLVTFARGVHTVARDVPLGELARTVSRLTEDELPPDDASDVAAGLDAAAETLEDAGRGAVLLVGDGHETRGNARAAARKLARRGFAVHVAALGGRFPEIGLYAADLPRQVELERQTWARLLLVGSAQRELSLELTLRQGSEAPVPWSRTLAGSGWFQLRQPLVFDDPGISFLDVDLRSAAGEQQHRRFFTYVSAPPRLLVVGDDHAWTRALPAERFRLEASAPEALDKDFNPSRYDAVILHEVEAERLDFSHLTRLAHHVEKSGLGLLLVNGPQVGGPEARTMLMSYDNTPLEELLPVINKPRPVLETPPPRDVVVLIDTSSSMGGWRLWKAKEIAAVLIDRLRALDRFHLIAFTGGAHPLASGLAMTSQGKQEATRIVSALRSGGGTNPTQALEMISGKSLRNCGLFLISDGEFASVSARPDCEATVFAIGKGAHNVPAALAEIAEPFPVPDDSFNPAGIRMGYFDPEPRNNRFEPGRFTPLPGVDAFQGGWSLLPDPGLPLAGNAVTHARADAEVAAVRPRPRDPVLAFRNVPQGGTVGAFTTRLPPSYYDSPAGGRAVTGWIERLLAHSERDRYAFRLEDRGEVIELGLTLLSKGGDVARIDRLSAVLERSGAGDVPVALVPDPELAGVFNGSVRLSPRPATATPARLLISESGPDALRRPQRIPFLIPPATERRRVVGSEAWSFGLDPELLRDVSALTGGRVLEPGAGATLLHGAGAASPSRQLWPWFAGAALVFLLLQAAARRILT